MAARVALAGAGMEEPVGKEGWLPTAASSGSNRGVMSNASLSAREGLAASTSGWT